MVFESRFKPEYKEFIEEYQGSFSYYIWMRLYDHHNRSLLGQVGRKRYMNAKLVRNRAMIVAKQLKRRASVEPGDVILFIVSNNRRLYISVIGALFAGATVCVGDPDDPETEHSYLINVTRPKLVFANASMVDELRRIKALRKLEFVIVLFDDIQTKTRLPSHEPDLVPYGVLSSLRLVFPAERPVEVEPDQAAFILLTSGSSGSPKPVARSHLNCLHTCLILDQAEGLWNITPESVLAGHLSLDHGTGLFLFKMAISKGCRLVLAERYEEEMMLKAIRRFKMTDMILGTPYVLRLCKNVKNISESRMRHLRNLIAVGSPLGIATPVVAFMRAFPNCCVRQAYGMSECGFISIVEREMADPTTNWPPDILTVGQLLPHTEVKLLDQKTGREIHEFNKPGRLYVRSPRVSPGYVGENFTAQSEAAFGADGFYRSNDICSIGRDGRLTVVGRINEMLSLLDGLKIAPSELEALLQMNAEVVEAAVVGVPHPAMPMADAPRAYVRLKTDPKTPRDFVLAERALNDWYSERVTRSKLLEGGIKIMTEPFPRIAIGKIDKMKLMRDDPILRDP